MHWKNHPAGFGLISKLLHWLIAALMLFLIGLGWYMVQLSYYHNWYHSSFQVHQWSGLLVWFAGIFMLVWNRFISKPQRLQSRHLLERLAAQVVHGLLFFVVLVTPLAGLLVTIADGNGLRMGEIELPLYFDVSDRARDWAAAMHYYLAYGTLALVLIHALAAIKHQLWDKDNTLRKMLW